MMEGFRIVNIDDFLLKFFLIYFLIMVISVLIELLNKSEYLSPIEIYNLNLFFNNFLKDLKNTSHIKEFDFEFYFNKYDSNSKKKITKIIKKIKKRFFISTIRKENDIYKIHFIDKFTLFRFLFIKFLAKGGVHRADIKIIKGKYKIIYFE